MEEKKRKNNNVANLAIVVAIFVGVIIYNMVNPAQVVEIDVDETEIVLSGYEDAQYHIPLASVERFTYVEDMEYPEETKGVLCGTYHNEQWGDYVLYVNGKVSACIAAETENGVYVFNYENAATTQSLHEALEKLI